MELYSIQPFWIYERLQRGEIFQATPPVCDPDAGENYEVRWRCAYDWLCKKMDERCSVSRPADVTYPIWAWYWWAGPKKRKPDLRFESTRHYATSEPCVLMTLDVPDGEVLLTEYHAWHHVLNAWYLAPEPAVDDFEARCEAKGLNPFRDKPLPDAALQAELEGTWDQIFDLAKIPALLEYEADESYVQATFWELRPEMVREAVWFETTGRSRKLELPELAAMA
jgi:hypothetical protein